MAITSTSHKGIELTAIDRGCNVTAHDVHPFQAPDLSPDQYPHLNIISGDTSNEQSVQTSFSQANSHFGPVNILIANAATSESNGCPIWDLALDTWEKTYQVNIRGTFLAIKHFLRAAHASQQTLGKELDNLAIVVVGNETGKLIRDVQRELVRLNRSARINAVTPVCIQDKPEDAVRVIAYLASHRAAGHISGQYFTVDRNIEGQLTWKNDTTDKTDLIQIPRPITKRNKIRVAVSIDLDAVSGWLGTGKFQHHDF